MKILLSLLLLLSSSFTSAMVASAPKEVYTAALEQMDPNKPTQVEITFKEDVKDTNGNILHAKGSKIRAKASDVDVKYKK